MTVTQLIDLPAIAIVLGGTIAATVLRCGWRDMRDMLRSLAQLPARPFNAASVKAELAGQVRAIQEDGLLRAELRGSGDDEFDGLSGTLIGRRSVQALYDEHERYRQKRLALAETGAGVLAAAAELAPVLGLAGTLISLGSLSSDVAEGGNYAAAIGMAITTTLYGLVIANFLFSPLAAAVKRRSSVEECARKELLDWLAQAVKDASGPRALREEVRKRAAPDGRRRNAA
ncbi:chemotaxis protein MotA [Altererythrobacter atlanticus]|uniref:Chemotaxis protein PomA n=1 Tax=Croceibacterium atlanticum TaxID=1267766 RepID=A0A0F7KZC4_9SPHN|nr:MotA/TolQ/ExbB proton channel family protein [Croceibacterium atlanticum]AKH44185.1 Chemotaxis protein PomA [Croceibacterium atlanticum]MBB5732496.1 chemotaxis protein MotA [Croceibacterium atlanticum]